MNSWLKTVLLVSLVTVPLLGAVACKPQTDVVVPGAEQPTGINASGHGEVQATPDTGFFTVGVEVSATTVEDARENAAKAADAVISAVRKNGVEDKDIKTTQFSIYPRYDYSKSGSQPQITGYTVTNMLQVKVRNLDNFSKVIDSAVKAGGNDARVQSIWFDIEDTTKLLEQAREAAMKDAKAKAEQLARLGGVGLGKPMLITETAGTNPPPLAAEKAAGGIATDTATPIQPGTGTVQVDVSVTWSIAD
ncbi:MAG: SIMPL domain-containing protein [Chloroflexi bacterium]|nr:SIMPL domain-containing protein [Chloroflexota bacterium]